MENVPVEDQEDTLDGHIWINDDPFTLLGNANSHCSTRILFGDEWCNISFDTTCPQARE